MPRKKVIYECKYCGREYGDWEVCHRCEKSHIKKYSDADIEEVVSDLIRVGERAHEYHIGGQVLGMPVVSFENLINEAVKRLGGSLF